MIEFLTLFLGLAAGPQHVELAASNDTSQVQVLLDGRLVAVDDDAPWQARLDLGPEVRPMLLEAVALDAEGNELGRSAQALNIPKPAAEARIALEQAPDGRVTEARLSWESTVQPDPERAEAWLDEEPLDASNPSHIPIPPYDASTLHLLQAELQFSADVLAQAQAVFGGTYVDRYRSDLTAFPVSIRQSARKLSATSLDVMSSWFATGESSRVVAFEKGGLDLILVKGPGVSTEILELEGTISQSLSSGGVSSGEGGLGRTSIGSRGLQVLANSSVGTAGERLRSIMTLDAKQRLRILAPHSRRQAGRSVDLEVFALSPEITAERGGLYWSLVQDVALPGLEPSLRLADAISVAGLQAANGNRRRAVLLVLAGPAEDASRHEAAAVRRFLSQLQVPLVVWRVGDAIDTWPEWGPGEDVHHFRGLQSAARRLADRLDRQRIVWLEGRHLPNAIRITQAAKQRVAQASAGS